MNHRGRAVLRRGVSKRCLQTTPIGLKSVWLVVEAPRVECISCGAVRRINLRIAEPRRKHTRLFERFVLALTKIITSQVLGH